MFRLGNVKFEALDRWLCQVCNYRVMCLKSREKYG